MKIITITKKLLWVLFVPLLFISCEDKPGEHYKVPDWLKGSAWEVLADRGNYSIFLDGVERAGYRPIMEGKSILSVMAPNDEAFTAYLKANGYSGIGDIKADELSKLIGFHLLYYSYNKERMVNFRPEGDGATDENKEVNAGLYYKFRTRSANSTTVELNPATGNHVTVYHLERFIPVFSYKFFHTKNIDAKANYEYFYPNSTWTGSDGFNVSNASVSEYSILADNGYVYAIDKVLEPMETIYTELEKRDGYSVFFELYDSYSTYEYDKTLSDDYGSTIGVDSLFLHKHGLSLPPIAMEWPVSSYQNTTMLTSISYSVFAPSNQALNDFFSRYWQKGGYTSLKDVDPLIMKYLLNQYVYGGSVVFPEEITAGKIKNSYGTKIEFNPAEVKDKEMCINGSFYGIDAMTTPALFSSVVGPAFQYKECANYLYILDGSSLLLSLVSPDAGFTTLIPTNAQMEEGGIYLNEYTSGKVLQKTGEDGNPADLSAKDMQSIVNMHIMNSKDGLKKNGTQVCPAQSAFNYWYVKDGKITSSALFTNYVNPLYTGDPFVPFTEITNDTPWSNGKAYVYDNSGLFQSESSDGLAYAISSCNDSRYPYYLFSQLMKKAGMISGTTINNLSGRFIVFIPTNDALKRALEDGSIPGVENGAVAADGTLEGTYNAVELSAYLSSFFVTSDMNVITTYPYPGSAMKSGTYLTTGNSNLIYTDNGSSLSVQLVGRGNTGRVISAYDYFPFAYSDGCFHLIDAIL